MLQAFDASGQEVVAPSGVLVPSEAVWVDLFDASAGERASAQAWLGVGLPSSEDMAEIEASSRLRADGKALRLTATVLSSGLTRDSKLRAVSFVLAGGKIVTLRDHDPRPFGAYRAHLLELAAAPLAERQALRAESVLVGLLEAIVDRLADLLETVGADMEGVSNEVFKRSAGLNRPRDYGEILSRIGRNGDLVAKAKESTVSLSRVIAFASWHLNVKRKPQGVGARLKSLLRDVRSIDEHANFLSSNITFALDATLGFINIEQSAIIKIFSVVAFIFLPPTLVASVYGMNFRVMPELDWAWGYPLALALMVVSAVLPWLFFKRRGWL